MLNRMQLTGAAVLFIAGCSSSTSHSNGPSNTTEDFAGRQNVTFHVADMNQQLQILWGDWPNKVKQALLELDGVEAVEDEWTRELESEEDLDLLFVAFDPRRVTIDDMMETIRKQGFAARVNEESAPENQVKQEK